jgi:hypothetical protein
MADWIGSQSVQRYTDGRDSGRRGPAVDDFPRTSDGIPGACTSPKKQMGPGVGYGLPLCASSRNGSHLSRRGRGAEPYCGPGCAHARQRPQRSKYQARARAQRFEASPVGSAPSVSCAQAASYPASGHDLPVASAVTGQAITGLNPASAQPACFQLVSAVTVADPDPSVADPDPSVADPDPSVANVMAETDFISLVRLAADWSPRTCTRVQQSAERHGHPGRSGPVAARPG